MRLTFATFLFRVAVVFALALGIASASDAQSLNWEGQTGGFVTPFATVVESPAGGFGRPMVSFTVLDAGEVVGTHFQLSLAAGIAGRAEIGYTKTALETGSAGDVSDLFDRGFQSLHAKVRFVNEDKATPAVPSISAGVQFHWQFGGLDGSTPIRNADVYLVATKSVPAGDRLAVVLNGGVKITNASLFAIAGTASDWTARGFAAAAVDVAGRVVVGGEILQQPKAFEGLPEADVPSTLSAFVRVTPVVDRLSVVLALVRLAGTIAPGIDADAVNRLGLGATFRF
jgi:hypothetical protein